MATTTKKAKSETVKKAKRGEETEAQKTQRMGPLRAILRWKAKTKTSRTGFLECGHKRTCGLSARHHTRCKRCLTAGTLGPMGKSKAPKAAKAAPAKAAPAKAAPAKAAEAA